MSEFLKEYFTGLMKSFSSSLDEEDVYSDKLALTIVVIVIGFLLYILFRKLIKSNVSDGPRKWIWQKVCKHTMVTLIVLVVLFIWIQAINVLVLIALLSGIFIVFMFRGLTNNIIGYFVIRSRQYFKVGHRVEINDIIGDVIEINLINITLLEVRNGLSSDSNTGRKIKIPNKIIFDESIEMIGRADTFISHEIKYVLSFDSDWQAAEQIMTAVGATYYDESVRPQLEKERNYLTDSEEKLHPVFSLNTNEDGIILVLRYVVDYRKGTPTKTYLQRQMLTQFADHPDIKFATVDIRILT